MVVIFCWLLTQLDVPQITNDFDVWKANFFFFSFLLQVFSKLKLEKTLGVSDLMCMLWKWKSRKFYVVLHLECCKELGKQRIKLPWCFTFPPLTEFSFSSGGIRTRIPLPWKKTEVARPESKFHKCSQTNLNLPWSSTLIEGHEEKNSALGRPEHL